MKHPLRRTWAALRRRLVLTVTVTVVLLAVVATGTAEYTVRHRIQSRVAKAAPGLGDDVSVGVADGWALWDLAHGSIPGSTSAATTPGSGGSPRSASGPGWTTSASAGRPRSPPPTWT